MYATCLHCHHSLGANDVVEAFPVGRRLAFDAAHGRLWVVCPRCREWNLTPIEERWEAIEECERQFRGTRLRASTDNIGLARLREGLELVRVGKPLLPEIAAWRYGAEFKRRRSKALADQATFMAPLYAITLLSSAQVVPEAVFALGAGFGVAGVVMLTRSRWRPRVVHADGRIERLSIRDTMHARVEQNGDAWALRYGSPTAKPYFSTTRLVGVPAERALRSVLAMTNQNGGRGAEIRGALELLDRVGGGQRFLARLARAWPAGRARGLHGLSPDVRLALEMALHAETERRALDGELAALEAEWRIAEEIAAIADNLFGSADAPRLPSSGPDTST